jgi:hypothetical protein
MTLESKKIERDGFTFLPWEELVDAMVDFSDALDELSYNNFDEEFIDAKNELVKKYLGEEFLPRRKK